MRVSLSLQRLVVDRLSLQNKKSFLKRYTPFSTYYDSQSGLHVELHNEGEISLILDVSNDLTSTSSFVPLQLYKEDSSSDMPDKLNELRRKGVIGAILPPITFPRDMRNLKTLQHIAPPGFLFFTSMNHSESVISFAASSSLSMMVDYSVRDADNAESSTRMKSYVEHGSSTTIKINDIGKGSDGPIVIANRIATLIDLTGSGDLIWLSSGNEDDADDMIQMCEELCYLDLPGKPVKSRLMVNSSNEKAVTEAMFSGVNKFVIDNEEQIALVTEIAEEQGKAII
ncbi:hypothetical protein ACHAXM_004146 [Skeletonema potamos]